MARLATVIGALDPHVAGITIAPLVLAAILPVAWLPWLIAIVPLGRLLVRARDLRRTGRSPLPHLLVNGFVVVLATVAGFMLSPA